MAMNMDAALRITAKVDGANNIASLNRSLQTVEGTAKGLSRVLSGLSDASQGLTSALGALAPLATIAGLLGLANNALTAGDRMYDLSQRTGASVEALAKFEKVASNTTIETVAAGLNRLSQGMIAASVGSKAAAAGFNAMKINIKDANGQIKASDKVMLEIADKFAKMKDGPEKTALAMELLGKSIGPELIPMLNNGGKAIEALDSKMTTAFAEKADEYNANMTVLSNKVRFLGADLLVTLLPALEATTLAATAAVEGFNSLPTTLQGTATAAAIFAIAWGPLGGLIKGTTAAFIVGEAAIQGVRLQMKLAAMEGIPLLNAAIMSIPGWGWALAGVTALAGLLTWIYKTNEGFRDFANNLADVVANDFKAAMDQMGQQASDTGKWINETWTWLVNGARSASSEIAKAFSSNFGFIGEMADWLSKNVGAKINEMVNAIPKSIRDKLGIVAQQVASGAVMALPGGASTLYAINAAQRASAMGGKPQGSAPSSAGSPPSAPGFTPDLTALQAAGGGAAARTRRTGVARPQDNSEALARTREGLLVDGMMADKRADYVQTQRQLNDLALSQNEASEAGNALLALQIEGRKALLESGLEQIKLQDESNRKLAESATNQDQQNRGLRDAVLQAELNATMTERQEAVRFRLAEIDQRIAAQRKKDASEQLDLERERATLLADSMARMEEMSTRSSIGTGAQQGIQAYVDSVGNLRDAVGQLTTNAIGGLEDSLTSLATTGAGNFKAFAASVLKDVTRMIIRQLVLKSIMQLIGGIGGSATAKSFEMPNAAFIPSGGYSFAPSALGNVFAANGIQPFAQGGIVNRPTLFPFAKGIGLMGEAGPEAIMPLRRGADGKLGVAGGGGGGTTNIAINVDASGTEAEGDTGNAGALARDLAAVVDERLIHHRRPGGLLAR